MHDIYLLTYLLGRCGEISDHPLPELTYFAGLENGFEKT